MNDQEMRERFAELKAYERASTPAFQPRSRSRSRSGSRGGTRVVGAGRVAGAGAWRVAGVVLTAAAVVVFFINQRKPRAPEMSITQWQAPSDILLQMTGTEWLNEVPTLKYEATP